MADIQLDTLEGKLIILNSAWEGTGVAIYDHFEKPLQDAVVAMTDFLQSVNSFIGIPIEDKLEVQRSRMNSLLDALQRGNLEEQLRAQFIDELNTEYKDYLPQLLDGQLILVSISSFVGYGSG